MSLYREKVGETFIQDVGVVRGSHHIVSQMNQDAARLQSFAANALQDAIIEAKEKGALDGASVEFKKEVDPETGAVKTAPVEFQQGTGAYSKAYNAALIQNFGNSVHLDSIKHFSELQKKYEYDPEGFAAAANAYRDEVTKRLPSQYRQAMSNQIDGVAVQNINSIKERVHKLAKKEALDVDTQMTNVLIDEVMAASKQYHAEKGELSGNFSEKMGQLNQHLENMIKLHPELNPAEVRQKFEVVKSVGFANIMEKDAIDVFNKKGYAAALKFVDDWHNQAGAEMGDKDLIRKIVMSQVEMTHKIKDVAEKEREKIGADMQKALANNVYSAIMAGDEERMKMITEKLPGYIGKDGVSPEYIYNLDRMIKSVMPGVPLEQQIDAIKEILQATYPEYDLSQIKALDHLKERVIKNPGGFTQQKSLSEYESSAKVIISDFQKKAEDGKKKLQALVDFQTHSGNASSPEFNSSFTALYDNFLKPTLYEQTVTPQQRSSMVMSLINDQVKKTGKVPDGMLKLFGDVLDEADTNYQTRQSIANMAKNIGLFGGKTVATPEQEQFIQQLSSHQVALLSLYSKYYGDIAPPTANTPPHVMRLYDQRKMEFDEARKQMKVFENLPDEEVAKRTGADQEVIEKASEAIRKKAIDNVSNALKVNIGGQLYTFGAGKNTLFGLPATKLVTLGDEDLSTNHVYLPESAANVLDLMRSSDMVLYGTVEALTGLSAKGLRHTMENLTGYVNKAIKVGAGNEIVTTPLYERKLKEAMFSAMRTAGHGGTSQIMSETVRLLGDQFGPEVFNGGQSKNGKRVFTMTEKPFGSAVKHDVRVTTPIVVDAVSAALKNNAMPGAITDNALALATNHVRLQYHSTDPETGRDLYRMYYHTKNMGESLVMDSKNGNRPALLPAPLMKDITGGPTDKEKADEVVRQFMDDIERRADRAARVDLENRFGVDAAKYAIGLMMSAARYNKEFYNDYRVRSIGSAYSSFIDSAKIDLYLELIDKDPEQTLMKARDNAGKPKEAPTMGEMP